MRSIEEAALAAGTVVITERNKTLSLGWLRSIGVDAPDMPGRCLHRPHSH